MTFPCKDSGNKFHDFSRLQEPALQVNFLRALVWIPTSINIISPCQWQRRAPSMPSIEQCVYGWINFQYFIWFIQPCLRREKSSWTHNQDLWLFFACNPGEQQMSTSFSLPLPLFHPPPSTTSPPFELLLRYSFWCVWVLFCL